MNANKITVMNTNINTRINTRQYASINSPINSSNQSKYNFLSQVLNKLNITINSNNCKINRKSQLEIESFLFDEFTTKGTNDVIKIRGLDSSVFGATLSNFIISKESFLDSYINNITKSLENSNKKNSSFMLAIFKQLGNQSVKNICIFHFLEILTYRNTNDENIYLLACALRRGKKLVTRYLYTLLEVDNKNSKQKISYSKWLETWKSGNESAMLVDDETFHLGLGSIVIDILISAELLERILVRTSKTEQHQELALADSKLDNHLSKHKILTLPPKLPMIVKPKPYTRNSIGGYLLNDIRYKENILIEKKAYSVNSEVSEVNNIYHMVNSISETPFKINKDLLEFITNDNSLGLLVDSEIEHEYASIEKRTKRQSSILRSYNSTVLLQEFILEIANFYKNFNEIYFPVRIDQRGRLYCTPSFLNYQSNELSMSLILFSNPGIINRNDNTSISYLKAYGANCYGGVVSKKSINSKVSWVDKNVDDIINYGNGKLLTKSKDKLLFIAFCMEFKRFYDFYVDDSKVKFKTYLPVQLDATCNGFQHMALLSNESTLFEELNLKSNSDETGRNPKDFYSFLLHKITNLFQSKVDSGEFDDKETGGSYLRLSEFVWSRSDVKKAIMTIPYNATRRSMNKYLTEALLFDKYDSTSNTVWYSSGTNGDKQLLISSKDTNLLINCLINVIFNDFEKIKKLTKYLKNVAMVYNAIGLPISWNLPSGLKVIQSYMKTKTTSITPFLHSKSKLNFNITLKDSYDKNKQVRALMPNLIHSLDATSLSLLYNTFSKRYKNAQFFSVHDCFGTTSEKVFILKTMLASVYTDLYSEDHYLYKFDRDIFTTLISNTDYKVDIAKRSILLPSGTTYIIHDIEWVLNKKSVTNKIINKIDSQHILI